MTGTVVAVCMGERRSGPKKECRAATLKKNFGLVGDAHAGSGHRQVSLLARESISAFLEKNVELPYGSFGENVVVEGIHLDALGLGTRLGLGCEAEVEVSQRGKICSAPCSIARRMGDCIMPREAIFCRVAKDGTLHPGDAVEVTELVGTDVIQVAVLTVSDRCAAGERRDESGPAIQRMVGEQRGWRVAEADVVGDVAGDIQGRLLDYCGRGGIDLVITTGGTGFSPRDVTPEATAAIVERRTPGLDEAMRAAGRENTPFAALSRGISGIRGSTLIINLPGSEKGARESFSALVPILPHAIAVLRGGGEELHP
jgi:molybdopterin adenylyltransferase